MLRLLPAWTLVTLALGAGPAHAITSEEAVARLNALRAQNGLPALVERPALSEGCRAHARYMALNGGWDAEAHDETPGRPGYSTAGAEAARRSVLAGPGGWTDPHPWAGSPEHQRLVMDPELAETGYGEHDGWTCLQVAKAPRPDLTGRIFTFSGPELIVYTPGAHAALQAPRVNGPEGTIGASASGAFIRPAAPLTAGTTYVAQVDVRFAATSCSRAGAPPVHPPCPARYKPWCYASVADYEPDWLPAEADPYDPVLCAPGQRPPTAPDAVVGARTVPHHWPFTTAGRAVQCPSALTAPTRVARRTPISLHVRLCGAASATVELRRGSRRVLRREARGAALRLSTRALAPGRYGLRVTVGARRFTRSVTLGR
jgi:hypothetical protein